MGDASMVMKAWRRQQTEMSTPKAVAIPERVSTTMNQSLATIWTEAQSLASESLSMAQQAWETEREEADALRTELAEAFEGQATELTTAHQTIITLQAELKSAKEATTKAAQTAERANTARQEIEQRANDYQIRVKELKTELTETQKAKEKVAGLEGKLETLQTQNAELLKVIKSK
jgi:chromosome segregation ATPase